MTKKIKSLIRMIDLGSSNLGSSKEEKFNSKLALYSIFRKMYESGDIDSSIDYKGLFKEEESRNSDLKGFIEIKEEEIERLKKQIKDNAYGRRDRARLGIMEKNYQEAIDAISKIRNEKEKLKTRLENKTNFYHQR